MVKKEARHEHSASAQTGIQSQSDRSALLAGQFKGIGPARTEETQGSILCGSSEALRAVRAASARTRGVSALAASLKVSGLSHFQFSYLSLQFGFCNDL